MIKQVKLIVFIYLITAEIFAETYSIYTISHSLPMNNSETVKKGYFINIGTQQGISKGTLLKVFRKISITNTADSNKRYDQNVPIGELEVYHSDETSSIAKIKEFYIKENDPLQEISGFMIGDNVEVKVSN